MLQAEEISKSKITFYIIDYCIAVIYLILICTSVMTNEAILENEISVKMSVQKFELFYIQ